MCDYILDSPLTNDDCLDSDSDPLKSEIDDLEDKTQAFYTKIQQEIVNEVVTEMARIDDAQKLYFEKLEQEKIDELKRFKERQQEEQKMVQKAFQNRLVGSTTIPPYCVCPSDPCAADKEENENTNQETLTRRKSKKVILLLISYLFGIL